MCMMVGIPPIHGKMRDGGRFANTTGDVISCEFHGIVGQIIVRPHCDITGIRVEGNHPQMTSFQVSDMFTPQFHPDMEVSENSGTPSYH